MNTAHKNKLTPITARVLIYAIFACLCHASAVYLFTLLNPHELPHGYLISTATYMLEHTLMSVLLTLAGGLLLQLIQNQKSE